MVVEYSDTESSADSVDGQLATEIMEEGSIHYVELKGYCRDYELNTYAKVLLAFKERLDEAGVYLMPSSDRVID